MNDIVWWSDGPSLPMHQLGWMLLALGGVLGIAFSVTYSRQLARRLQPLWIYRRIATDLHLTIKQQWRLYRIARQQQLTSPLTLLLSPATFTHHTSAYLSQVQPRKLPSHETQVRGLREHLFGDA